MPLARLDRVRIGLAAAANRGRRGWPTRGGYWGADEDAEDVGGRMSAAGRAWLLLPRAVSR